MKGLTTHVLDTKNGRPAAGMKIELYSRGKLLKAATTNADGRTDAPMLNEQEFAAGDYEIVFHVGEYFGDRSFLDQVPVRFTFDAGAKPTGPLRYQVFAQAPEVAGYDVVQVTRDGSTLSGYVAFENSTARQTLPPSAFSVKGTSLSIDVPFDPILGSTAFQWRATLSTAAGPQISDYVPSPAGLKGFLAKGG